MDDINQVVFTHADGDEISDSLSAVTTRLPRELSRQVTRIFCEYFAAHGVEGTIARLNGKSVHQIVSEHQQGKAKLVASGELDDVRFNLYEASPESND
jgi:hypothetical protein